MKLTQPFFISSRLLPAVKIAECTVSLNPDNDHYFFDFPNGRNVQGRDFSSPRSAKGKDIQQSMAALLGFVSAFAESVAYSERNNCESENADLFPVCMREWATQNSDEISMLAYDLEEGDRVVEY